MSTLFQNVTSSYRRKSLRRRISAGAAPVGLGEGGSGHIGGTAGQKAGSTRSLDRGLRGPGGPAMISCINPMSSREDLRLVGLLVETVIILSAWDLCAL